MTVAVTGFDAGWRTGARAARPRFTPPDTHMFCSAIGLGTRVAMPWRSPVVEWQLAHCFAKNASPALASPTRMFSSVSGPGGGPPWFVPCACRPWSQAAIALISSTATGSGGIGGGPGRPFCTTGMISSPSLSSRTSCERSRFGPPS